MWCLWDNVEKYGRARQTTDDNIIWCMHFTCCIAMVYVVLIVSPWQKLWCECTSILHDMYIACLFKGYLQYRDITESASS